MSYDLVRAGAHHREQLIQKKVSTLQDEVLLLEAGGCVVQSWVACKIH